MKVKSLGTIIGPKLNDILQHAIMPKEACFGLPGQSCCGFVKLGCATTFQGDSGDGARKVTRMVAQGQNHTGILEGLSWGLGPSVAGFVFARGNKN